MLKVTYDEVREEMQIGDVIAFSGRGGFSKLIKHVTHSNISHVGTILNSSFIQNISLVQIIESTSFAKGKAGVVFNRMSEHIKNYKGEIYWLPLKVSIRKHFDILKFISFIFAQQGKDYDMPQALGSAIDLIMDNREDLDKLFCSELVTAGFEAGGILRNINASEQTPRDVINFDLYEDMYQLK